MRLCTPEQAAAGLFTGLWDHLAIVGNDGRIPVARLALPWNLFNEQSTDGTFGMALSADPYLPTLSGRAIELLLNLTKGMRIVAADPRRTGMIALRGAGRTLWVWQNRTGWTDQPGTSVELRGVPDEAREIEVFGWDGLRKRVAVEGGGNVTIEGLEQEQTHVFVVRAEEGGDPDALLPERAAKRVELREMASGTDKDDVPPPYAVLAQETFDYEGGQLKS